MLIWFAGCFSLRILVLNGPISPDSLCLTNNIVELDRWLKVMPFLPKLFTNVHISVWSLVPVRDVIWVFWLGQQMALFPLDQTGPGGGHASPGQLFKQVPFSISLAITPNRQFGHFGALCQYLWSRLASCTFSLVSILPDRQKARNFLCCM